MSPNLLEQRTINTPRALIPPQCRARAIKGNADVDCLVERTTRCKYREMFGFSDFCTHPRKQEIAARTEPEKRGKSGKKPTL